MKIEKKALYTLSILVTSTLFTGCTTPSESLKPSVKTAKKEIKNTKHYAQQELNRQFENPTPTKESYYENTMRKIASGIPEDPEYQRISLDTQEKKKWFRTLTYRLWDRQITRYEFLAEGLKKYPTHKHEFNFIINGLTSAYNN